MTVRMKNIFLIVAVGALALFSGCASTCTRQEPRTVYLTDSCGFDPSKLVESLLDFKGTRVQAVAGQWKDNVFSASSVMKGDGEKFTAVFSAPQMRLLTITVSRPCKLEWKKAAVLPDALHPEYALVDIAFAVLDADTLKKSLGDGFSVEDDGRTRRISRNGRILAVFERLEDGEFKYSNPVRGYSYTIKDLS
jgi:hypothetical protein